jgi:hypothetical protein
VNDNPLYGHPPITTALAGTNPALNVGIVAQETTKGHKDFSSWPFAVKKGGLSGDCHFTLNHNTHIRFSWKFRSHQPTHILSLKMNPESIPLPQHSSLSQDSQHASALETLPPIGPPARVNHTQSV